MRELCIRDPDYRACMQSSMRLTTSTPDDGPALIRISTPLSPGEISLVMSPEYQA